MSPFRVAVLCLALLAMSSTLGGQSTAPAASITHDESAHTYTLLAGGAKLVLSIDRSVDYALLILESSTGRNWTAAPGPDTWVTIDNKPEPFGSRKAGFEFEGVITARVARKLQLSASYRYKPANVRVTRHIAIVDGSPTFEMWTTFDSLGQDVTLSDLNAFELRVPEGAIHWLNGLKGSASDTPNAEAFSLRTTRLGVGEGLTLSSSGRSSEDSVPWFAIDGEGDEFYAGLRWSGAWTLNIRRVPDALALSFGLEHMSTDLTSGSVEGPHVVFGASRGRLSDVSQVLRTYIIEGLRDGRGFAPLVTFNTWFVDGTRIADGSVRDTMARAAALGTELFVLDAGWYAGAGAQGIFDFHSGLGRWRPDPDRFPDGLGALSDHAHSLGMRFGIWVEPERIDLDVVAEEGADSSWLATAGDRHVTDRTGQLCLAGEAGRRWVWERLTSFIDEVRPDYLKWDNNAWLNCDREGHGHGSADGNYAHIQGLYGLLEDLRARYPDLLIENVSGGGNRLDFGMLRYTDVGWMDDRSSPSAHVRHHVQGLSAAFPPAYLFSFVTTQDASEQLGSYQDLPLHLRSRMMGALGLSFGLAGLTTADAIAREVNIYKTLRTVLNEASGALLTAQAQMENGPPWDVLQSTTPGASAALVYAFQGPLDPERLNVKPLALDPDARYHVESVDFGSLGDVDGSALMQDGIDIYPSERTAAHILILRRIP